MKKYITPEHYVLLQANLFIFTFIFISYNLRTLALVITGIQIALLVFFVWYVGWQQSKEEIRQLRNRQITL